MALPTRRRIDCEELCRKRLEIESTLGLRETDLEKCLKICRSFSKD